MNPIDDLTEDELRVLQGARRALSPTAEDAARVLAATELALTSPGAPLASSESALLHGLGAKLMAAVVIGAVSGAIGYYAGYRAAATPAGRTVGVSVAAAPVRSEASAATPTVPSLAPAAPSPVRAEEPTQVEVAPKATSLARPRMRDTARVEPDAGVAALGPVSLQVELDALRRVERALRDGEPKQALAILVELDRTVPDGKLDEERSAAFVMARCAVKLGTPAGLVSEFTRKYPQSAYVARVRSSCKDHPR